MNDFSFSMPTKVVFGRGMTDHTGSELASRGFRHALVVYGKGSVVRTGTLDRVLASLDAAGVAVRTGHHCAQPIHQHFGIHASSRLSFGACSTPEEVDRFLSAIADVRRYFQR